MQLTELIGQNAKLLLKLVTIPNPAFTCVLEFISSKFHADLVRYYPDQLSQTNLLKLVPPELHLNLVEKLAFELSLLTKILPEIKDIRFLLAGKVVQYKEMIIELTDMESEELTDN